MCTVTLVFCVSFSFSFSCSLSSSLLFSGPVSVFLEVFEVFEDGELEREREREWERKGECGVGDCMVWRGRFRGL